MIRADVAVIGAGMAGASLAAELVGAGRIVLIEAEDMPGYHATGRSAAFWSETYGGAGVQPLTSASGDYLRGGGFLAPLGSLHVGRREDQAAADAFLAEFEGTGVALERVDPAAHVPGLRPDWVVGVAEPSCAYIDVAALHAHYLARARAGGVELLTRAELLAAERTDGAWRIETRAGPVIADTLANAAGAWGDVVAKRAGIAPFALAAYRRTMVQLRTDPPVPEGLPHVAHLGGGFYFKPEGRGRLWLSPHDEIPDTPGDVAPEEIDVAIAIDRFEQLVDWRVAAVERRWAGLRTFAPDRLPVFGWSAVAPGFFWCVGQGGFGIQTAPAAAQIAAALLRRDALPAPVAAIDVAAYAPARFGA